MHELKDHPDDLESDVDGSNYDFEFNDPAEVLVELARRGELDPWDIDIAKTTERFLEFIDSLERRDLRIPARTLLYASILLRMKSDSMEEQDEEEELEEELEIVEPEPAVQLPKPPVRRRTRRPVTLDELISELKKAEMVGRRKAMRERWQDEETDEILDLSHEEGIEDRIRTLVPIIDELFEVKDRVEFKEIEGDSVLNYVAVLFMAHRKELWLEQAEMWGDLYLKRSQ